DATEFDLGTKIKTPKEVMLEELSLMKGKGSRMFQMRQQRVDKFIINTRSKYDVYNWCNHSCGLPSLSYKLFFSLLTIKSLSQCDIFLICVLTSFSFFLLFLPIFQQNLQILAPPVNCEKIPPKTLPKPDHPKDEVEPETEQVEKKDRECVQTYVSPWEHAMKDDDELKATMKSQMPGPHVHKDLPQYKSFNRTALPFGGSDKASHLLNFELPEVKVGSEEPEKLPVFQCHIDSRPSFNRTPIGWVCSEEPSYIPLNLEPIPFEGETEDL
ncbi:myozenin 1, partial [Silurus asotus]